MQPTLFCFYFRLPNDVNKINYLSIRESLDFQRGERHSSSPSFSTSSGSNLFFLFSSPYLFSSSFSSYFSFSCLNASSMLSPSASLLSSIYFFLPDSIASEGADPLQCRHLVSLYLIPNFLHFIAYVIGCWHFRTSMELVEALTQKVCV